MKTSILMGTVVVAALAGSAIACENLAELRLPNTTISLAQTVLSGPFTPPNGSAINGLPAFCRVAGVIKPSSDSDIKFEVWMPTTGWNGKFRGVGNGGFAGSLQFPGMAAALSKGYATATTDTGHTGANASWALGHPEKVVDYGYRGIHEMTEKAKAIIAAFYGSGPKKSYFESCSNGGRQALMEAQRYPGDYDGIIAGAPANDFTHIVTGFLWNQQALLKDPKSFIPPAKLKAIETAVLTACDKDDGLADGLVDDPTRCAFKPASLVCKGADTENCLTKPQVAALTKIYGGPTDSKGRIVFPGFVPGGETGNGGWGAWITGATPEKSLQYFFGAEMFRNMVTGDPAWDFKTFTVDEGGKMLDDKLARVLNATDVNLEPFQARGGKLILYHGWCDAALTPLNTIKYYEGVVAKAGAKKAEEFVRLYMLPGVQHCGGGVGPNKFVDGMQLALERWVEQGSAPDSLTAANETQGKVTRTRPICPYPRVARYKGTGDVNDAASFTCTAPASKSRSAAP